MANCLYCRFGDGKHDPACPQAVPSKKKAEAFMHWGAGYHQGRSGGKKPAEANPTFTLGYLNGESALEEAQNGEPFFSATDIEDLDFENLSLDDLDNPNDPDTIRRGT